jgi:hypothetical protein
MRETPCHLILANGIRHADNTAAIDWGWKRANRAGRRGWENDKGEFVMYAHDSTQLRGLSPGTKIYLGFAWDRDLRMIDMLNHIRNTRDDVHIISSPLEL